ncbi:MAG: M66 family metalloprotease [Deltaproteobacteria bacterium]
MMGLIAPEDVPDLKFPIPTQGGRLTTGSNGLINGVDRVQTIPLTTILSNPANYSGDNVPKEYRLRSSQYVGPRSPSHQGVSTDDPKEFTALMVLITKDSLFDQKKPNWKWENGGWVQKEGDTLALDGFHDDIKWLASTDERDVSALNSITWQDTTNLNTREFGGTTYLSKPNIRFNFFQATNGLGRLNIDLSNSIRNSNTSRLVSSRLSRSGLVRPDSGQEPAIDANDNDEFFAPDYALDLAGYSRNSRSLARSSANTDTTPADTSIVLCSYEFDLTSTLVVSGLNAGGRSCTEVGTLDASVVAEVEVPDDPADAEAGGVKTSISSATISVYEGTSTTQTFELNSQPNGIVTITFTSDNTAEAKVSPTKLTFDGKTWNKPQILTISAPEDYTVDGDQTSTISYRITSTFAADVINGKTDNFTVKTLDSKKELDAGGDAGGSDGTTDSGGTDGSSGGDSGGSTGGSTGGSAGSGIALDGTWQNLTIASLGTVPDVDEDPGAPFAWNANYGSRPEIITEATDDGLLIGWNGEIGGEKKIVVSKIWSDGTDYELAGHQLVDSIGHIHGLTVDPDTGDFFVFSGSDEIADRSPSWDCCPKQKNGRLTLQKFDGTGKRYEDFDSFSVSLFDYEVADGIVDITLDSHEGHDRFKGADHIINKRWADYTKKQTADEYTDYGFPAAGWPLLSSRWSSSTAFNDGKIAISMSQNTPLDGNGVRHQFSRQIVLRASDGLVIDDFGATSHSFDQRVVANTKGSGFMGLDLGDVYPRGIVLKQWTGKALTGYQPKPGGGYDFGGKQWLKRNLNLFHIKGGQQTGGVHYNQVMTRLGNIAVGNNGYPVLFSTENSNNFEAVHNSSRNLVLVHVKDQTQDLDIDGKFVVDGNADNKDYLSDSGFEDGTKSLEVTTDAGKKTNNNLVWLTEYSDKDLYNAEKPKLAKIGPDRFVVLWESWTGNKPWPNNKGNYENTWAMVIDEFGNKIEEASNLGTVRLERSSEVTVFQGDKVAWARGDQETSKLTLYVLSFDENATAGQRLSLESHDFTDTTVTVTSYPEASNVGPIVAETSQSTTDQLAGRDFSGKSITYQKVTDPTNGTVVVNATTGEFTYTNNGTAGADSFTYKVYHTEDSSIESTVATVSFDVRQRFAEPSNPISDLSVSTGTGSVTLNWSANAGDQAPQGYLVLCSATPQGFDLPEDTKTLPEDAECADGKGAVYVTTTSYTWSNLGEGNYYFFRVYPHTNQDNFIDYNTEAPETKTNLEGSQYMVAQTHVIPLKGKTWDLRDDGRPLKGPNGGEIDKPVPMNLHLVANKKTLVLVESVEKKAGDTVEVTLADGSTKQFTLNGPDTLPPTAGDPNNKYSTTALWTYLDAEWVQPNMKLDGQDVNVGQPSTFQLFNLPFYLFGASESTKDRDLTLDLSVTGGMNTQTNREIFAKLPIAEFQERLHPLKKVEWPYLLVSPRSGGEAYKLESSDDMREGFAAISGVMRALGQIKYSNGYSDQTNTQFYSSIIMHNEAGNYAGPGGGLGGGNIGAGDYSYTAVYHHEQGHAFDIPHAGQAYNSYEYPYEDGSLRGSGWGFDIVREEFLANTMPKGAPHYSRCEAGQRLKDDQGRCFSRDPMWGGGGDHPAEYVLQIFSDFNAAKIQRYFERTRHYGSKGRYTYDNASGIWRSWNPETLSFDSNSMEELDKPTNAYYQDLPAPNQVDVMVDTVVFTLSNPEIRDYVAGTKTETTLTQIYPALLNYKGSARMNVDLDNATQVAEIKRGGRKGNYCYWGNCDFSIHLTYQDGSTRRFLYRGANYENM